MKLRYIAVAALFALFGFTITRSMLGADAGAWPSSSPTAVPAAINTLLDRVDVVDERPDPSGYDRECGRGHACVFGSAWSDDHASPGGHNGCDTRNDVLALQMRDVSFKPGTGGCVVLVGELADPYTGKSIRWTKTNPATVQVDHVYPLALAWDMGASTWPQQKRIDFANDQLRNLLAVSGKANQSKGDSSPAEWLVPENPGFRCAYAARYLQVAVLYDLPITKADAKAIKRAASGCPAH